MLEISTEICTTLVKQRLVTGELKTKCIVFILVFIKSSFTLARKSLSSNCTESSIQQ